MNHEETNQGMLIRLWSALFRESRQKEQDAAAYRRLALQLHYDAPRGGTRSAMLVSPTASAVSALGALSLASNLAHELGNSVLLVDACPSRPELSHLLGATDCAGWANLLTGYSDSLDEVVLPTSSEGLSFLPAGRGAGVAPSAAASEAVAQAVHERYDFVLISGGSVLDEGSGLGLMPHVGCVLLLVAEDETTVDELKAAQHALKLCKAQDVRIVLTSPTRARETYPSIVRAQKHAPARAVGKLVAE